MAVLIVTLQATLQELTSNPVAMEVQGAAVQVVNVLALVESHRHLRYLLDLVFMVIMEEVLLLVTLIMVRAEEVQAQSE